MKDLSDAAKIQGTVIDLQRAILEAQSSAFEAQQAQAEQVGHIRALEEEMARLKAWGAEKENYELKAIGNGAFAYMLKPAMRGTEPPHWLCQHCYENGKKSVLQIQPGLPSGRKETIQCPRCGAKLAVMAGAGPRWI